MSCPCNFDLITVEVRKYISSKVTLKNILFEITARIDFRLLSSISNSCKRNNCKEILYQPL